jgi:hypothetical protein
MRAMSLPLAGKNGYINMLEIGDFEYVDPFIKMHDIYIANGVWMEVNKQRLQFGEGGFNETEAWDIGGESGHRDFVSHLLEAGALKIPEPMKKLLTLKKKARQQSCINQLKLTTNLVMSFIYEACKEHEFTYSMYTGRVRFEKGNAHLVDYLDIINILANATTKNASCSSGGNSKGNVPRSAHNQRNCPCR